jgi:hypothetical protein
MSSSAGKGFALTPEQEASFDGTPRFIKVNGPLSLLRLIGEQEGRSDADYKMSSPVGVFWFNSRFFWNIIEEVTNNAVDKRNADYVNSLVRMLVREKTAVSQNWNTLSLIVTLSLPQGQTLEAWVGRIKPQPLNQPGSVRAGVYGPGPTLPGRGFQYIIENNALKTTLKPYVSTDPRPFWISGVSHLNVRQ